MAGVFNFCLLLFLDGTQGSPVLSYALSSTSPQYVYQLYDIPSLTKSEAEEICGHCSSGKVAIVQDMTTHDFIRNALASTAGILNGFYWLGLTKGVLSRKWDNGDSLDWAPWAPSNPGTWDKYAEARLSDTPEWYSRNEDYKPGTDSFLVCQYDGATLGEMDNSWREWSRCDVDRNLQIRRKPCTSPAADDTAGCTCESHVTETRQCPDTTPELFQSPDNIIYQKYNMAADWFQAIALCGRCETGTIMMPKTSQEDEFITNTIQLTANKNYFIGLTYDLASNGWGWIDGAPLTWTNWGIGSPGSNPEKTVASMTYYVVLLLTGTYWRSEHVSDVAEGVICQYDSSQSGLYGEWEPWGGCVSDFTGTWTGVRSRKKRCKTPGMVPGGCSCEDEITETQTCTPAAVDLYFTGSDAYLLFDAGADTERADQICSTWCANFPTGVVQYQSQSKYQDIYNQLISLHGFKKHHVGLSDLLSEGYWTWQDESKHQGFPDWQTTGQHGGYLLNDAMITAETVPYLTPVMFESTFLADISDSVVCEYPGVVDPNGTYTGWSPWSDCVAEIQTRNRTCLVPAPTLSGGCHCAGEEWQSQNCTVSTTSTTSSTSMSASTSTSTSTPTSTSSSTSPPPSSSTSSSSSSLSLSSSSLPSSSATTTTTTATTPRSTAVSPGTDTVTTAVPKVCVCRRCPNITFTDKTIEEKVKEIIDNLTIAKISLSSTRRRLTSADDERPSAKNIGICIGSVVVGAVASFVLFMDLEFVVRFIRTLNIT